MDILCGSDYFWNFHEGETIPGGAREPVAIKTSLGWVLYGQMKGGKLLTNDSAIVNFVQDIFPPS